MVDEPPIGGKSDAEREIELLDDVVRALMEEGITDYEYFFDQVQQRMGKEQYDDLNNFPSHVCRRYGNYIFHLLSFYMKEPPQDFREWEMEDFDGNVEDVLRGVPLEDRKGGPVAEKIIRVVREELQKRLLVTELGRKTADPAFYRSGNEALEQDYVDGQKEARDFLLQCALEYLRRYDGNFYDDIWK